MLITRVGLRCGTTASGLQKIADNFLRRFGRIEVTDHLGASLLDRFPVRVVPELHLVTRSQVFVDIIPHRRGDNGLPKSMLSTQFQELDDRGRDSCQRSVRYPMEVENPVKFEVAAITGTCRAGVKKVSSGVEKQTY
jgi:hypothetical protein